MSVSAETTPEPKLRSSWSSSACSRNARLEKTPQRRWRGRSGGGSELQATPHFEISRPVLRADGPLLIRNGSWWSPIVASQGTTGPTRSLVGRVGTDERFFATMARTRRLRFGEPSMWPSAGRP